MTQDHGAVQVGSISNYYGGILLKREGGVDFWCIENYCGPSWSPCPPHVAEALRTLVSAEDLAGADSEEAGEW